VLLVENFIEGKRTPTPKPGSHSQELIADINIGKDGSIKGDVKVKLEGNPAVSARSNWRNVTRDQEDEWLKNRFSANGHIGAATISKDDPKPLAGTFNYSMTFERPDYLLTDSAGAFVAHSPALSYLSVSDLAWVPDQIEEHPITCSHGRSKETFVYHLPDNFRILDVPNDKTIDGQYLHYEARYQQDKHTLTVTRLLEDSTPGPICEPSIIAAQQETLQKISRNLRGQIVYKPILEDD